MRDSTCDFRHGPSRAMLAVCATAILCVPSLGAQQGQQLKATVEPAFPARSESLVLVEGEDAVSTNFAREPILNYDCSGSRTLQLNRSTGLQGIGSFYADYVFTVPAGGTWELWYGGTPPGTRDELNPSYASPVQVTVDAGKPLDVHRESVSVVENYSPSYYWTLVGELTLEAQRHRIRFEVTEKRRIDGRFFFYLDCFFLVKKEGGKRVLTAPLPAVFPRNLDNRTIDTPFMAVDDALIRIRDNPGQVEPLIQLSLLYTLLGDYLNALKYLGRASVLQPQNMEVLLLTAKNRIWKGDAADGLKKYRELLDKDPQRRELWLEAGKVAAWSGLYEDSIRFYRDALAAFPNDLDLLVNLGLAYLWSSRGQDADKVFAEAAGIAGTDATLLKAIGGIYRVNGYPDRAILSYKAAIAASPQDLESYLLLIGTWDSLGKKEEAEKIQKLIADAFTPSPRLESYLEGFTEKEGLKEQVMEEYRQKLASNPDNLVLRQTLAQAYFWNGLRGNAIDEYRHILDNHAYLAIKDMENRSSRLIEFLDRGYVLSDFFSSIPASVQKSRSALSAGLSKYKQTLAARDAARKSFEAAQAAQSKTRAAAEADKAAEAVRSAEDRLQAAEGVVGKEAGALAQVAAESRSRVGQFSTLWLALTVDREQIGALLETDRAAEEALDPVTKASHWRFDRAETLSELAPDLKDNALARLVTAKIYLMDRQASAAQKILSSTPVETGSAAGASYTLAQARLWAGQVGEALPIFSRLSGDADPASVPPYFDELQRLVQSIQSPPPALATATDDPVADANAAASALSIAEKEAATARTQLQKDLALLHELYRRAMVRAFYASDEATSSIRNELGDYYLAQEDLGNAIAQFRKVLLVDPNDLSATFRLGKVYQWNRDWKAALVSYKAVYRVDPYFENVASLYNQVSKEHADTVSSFAYYLADPQQVQWHAEAHWNQSFDSVWGLNAAYQTDSMRIRQDVSGVTDHSAWQVHDVSIGVPIDLYSMNLKITPAVGGFLVANQVFAQTTPPDTPVKTKDLFGAYTAEPYGKLDASLGFTKALYLTTSLRGGRYLATFDALRTAVYDASGEANLSTSLSFIDAWPLHDMSLRTYGRADYLVDGSFHYQNLLYTAGQEVTITLLKGGNPYSLLTFTPGITWQDSTRAEPSLYYAPRGVLVAGGSIMGSTWIGVGDGSVLGLSARGFLGSYQEHLREPASTLSRAKLEAQLDANLTRGSSTWGITAMATATYNPSLADPWDYWSSFVKVSYTTQLAEVLAP
jgi:Flp pilus assembly protein TadD